jgi:cardiolipin synthase
MRLRALCRSFATASAWWLLLLLLLAAAGCRAPATPYQFGKDEPPQKCCLVLASQILTDTGAAFAESPLKSGWELLCEMHDHVVCAVKGAVGKHLIMPWQSPPPLRPDAAPLDPAALEKCLRDLTGKDLQPAHVQLHTDGAEALASLHALIDRATTSIDVMMFIWENDSVGSEIATHLASRAGPNLHVRVLIDGGGNLVFCKRKNAPDGRFNRVIAELSHHPNVEVIRIRNPFARFDHRKLVLVDGQAAWTGGRNFTSCAFFNQHDLSFTLTGPLATEMQSTFDRCWIKQGGQLELRDPSHEPTLALTVAHSPTASQPANAMARIVTTEPCQHEIGHALYRAVDHACRHVYVENVYFSDGRLVTKLAQARRRGVDVRVVLTFSSSSPCINCANKVVANRLLQAGVRVYSYPIMTHAKAASVDGCWAYLGTGNFDPLSLRHNHELGLAVSAGLLIAELEEKLFLADFRAEWELTEPLALEWSDYFSEVVAGLML